MTPMMWVRNFTLTQLYHPDLLPQGLTQMWSLATEAAFYVLLPFLCALLLGPRHPAAALPAGGARLRTPGSGQRRRRRLAGHRRHGSRGAGPLRTVAPRLPAVVLRGPGPGHIERAGAGGQPSHPGPVVPVLGPRPARVLGGCGPGLRARLHAAGRAAHPGLADRVGGRLQVRALRRQQRAGGPPAGLRPPAGAPDPALVQPAACRSSSGRSPTACSASIYWC